MFGAREVKSVSRFVQEHARAWRPIHSAILGCLLAHRNHQSQRCDPSRALLAQHCNVSERTIDRAVAQLRAWGAIATSQPRMVGRNFARTQYTLLFEQAEGAPCDKAVSLSARDNGDASVRQKPGVACDSSVRQTACDKAVSTEAFESRSSIEAQEEGKGEATAPHKKPNSNFSQTDFDERDMRKLTEELAAIYRSLEGARIADSEYEREEEGAAHSHEGIFHQACARARIPVARAMELTDADWKKKNPGRNPFDEEGATGTWGANAKKGKGS